MGGWGAVRVRDGNAVAGDADSCGLMRICGCDAEDKICMRIVGKKTRSKIEQNWPKMGQNTTKTVKILNKNSQKSIKNRPKNGPKMVIFFTTVMWKCAYSRINAL